MRLPFDTSTWPSPQELKQRHRKGESLAAIATSLGASRPTLRKYLNGQLPSQAEKKTIVSCDQAFVAAMTKAIRAGDEHATVGVKADHRPASGHRIRPTFHSGCGSPAAACAAG